MGISIAPKFVDLSQEALEAKLITAEKAFVTGVQLAHTKWRVNGSPTDNDERNDMQLYGSSTSGQVDMSIWGWPAQSDSSSAIILTNSDADCLSLWTVLMQSGDESAATDDSADFIANFEGASICSYSYTDNPNYGIEYSSVDGTVTEFTDGGGGGAGAVWLILLMLLSSILIRGIEKS